MEVAIKMEGSVPLMMWFLRVTMTATIPTTVETRPKHNASESLIETVE
jgi:hypothetical protein